MNAYPAAEEPQIPVLDIDNDAVRESQVKRLEQLKRERDADAVRGALGRLEQCAATGEGNLLERAVDAARKRATLGEISLALEKVWGRYEATTRTIAGVYSAASAGSEEFKKARRMVEEFEREEGRRPRILVAKMGQDGHDRGAKVIATAFADIGFDVDIGPLFQTPREVARFAMDSDVHVVGVSSLAAGHKTLVPQLIAELARAGPRRHSGGGGRSDSTAGLQIPVRRRRGGNLWAGNCDSDGGAKNSGDAECQRDRHNRGEAETMKSALRERPGVGTPEAPRIEKKKRRPLSRENIWTEFCAATAPCWRAPSR